MAVLVDFEVAAVCRVIATRRAAGTWLARPLVLAAVLAACGSDKPSRTTGAAPALAATAAPASVTVESLVADDVTGVMRGSPQDFPMLSIVGSLVGTVPCWPSLRGAVTAAYQLEQAATRTSYVVLSGNLPRADVEACAREAAAVTSALHVTTAGDALVITLDGAQGALHLAWRGDLIVAGTADQVARATAGATAEVAATWRERLALLPRAQLAAWRDDALLTNLLGVTTTAYVFAMDGAREPKPDFTIRIHAYFATASDAAIAARKLGAAEIEPRLAPPPELVAAIKKFKVAQDNIRVDVTMTYAMFEQAGVDFAVLQRWVAGIQP